jgi:DNA-binding XRE family transcriptional regulator
LSSSEVYPVGRIPRHTPKFLGKKLAEIRQSLGINTLDGMAKRIDIEEINLYRSTIHDYENGKREPPLIVLLRYSELSGITINDLVDDRIELKL